MKLNNVNSNVFWTSYSLIRQSGGAYYGSLVIDEKWLLKQRVRISSSKSTCTYIVVDEFLAKVYSHTLAKEALCAFQLDLERALQVPVLLESDLIERYWDRDSFTDFYEEQLRLVMKMSSEIEIVKEMATRKQMYNPYNYAIPTVELFALAMSASAFFRVEDMLLARFHIGQNR